jgi:hypothetical protein
MVVVIGTDPSTAPNLALVCSERGWLDVASRDLTSVAISKTKREPVAELIAAKMREWILFEDVTWLVSEKIGPWTGQGLVSSANFVGAMRLVEGIAVGLGLRVAYYTPPAWKRGVGLLTKDADYSRALAARLWPKRSSWVARKSDHNEAEAALIGYHHLQTLRKVTP